MFSKAYVSTARVSWSYRGCNWCGRGESCRRGASARCRCRRPTIENSRTPAPSGRTVDMRTVQTRAPVWTADSTSLLVRTSPHALVTCSDPIQTARVSGRFRMSRSCRRRPGVREFSIVGRLQRHLADAPRRQDSPRPTSYSRDSSSSRRAVLTYAFENIANLADADPKNWTLYLPCSGVDRRAADTV